MQMDSPERVLNQFDESDSTSSFLMYLTERDEKSLIELLNPAAICWHQRLTIWLLYSRSDFYAFVISSRLLTTAIKAKPQLYQLFDTFCVTVNFYDRCNFNVYVYNFYAPDCCLTFSQFLALIDQHMSLAKTFNCIHECFICWKPHNVFETTGKLVDWRSSSYAQQTFRLIEPALHWMFQQATN